MGLVLAIFLALLQVGDVLTTQKILVNGRELNPILNWLFAKYGHHNVLIAKSFIVVCIGTIFAVYEPLALIPLCALYTGVVCWNGYQIYKG